MKNIKKAENPSDCCRPGSVTKLGTDSGTIYGMGVLGALFYFLQGASGFSEIAVGIFKSLFWPAFLMFRLFSSLQM